jgi:predicted nucleotidyltransferase
LPTTSIAKFLDFLVDSLPEGDVYLFGGVLRDLAVHGGRGFNSDIDVVVEGAWGNCIKYLEHLGARRNKFGGYRLEVATWLVDIWNAKETWAISSGLVEYKGIASLTETTVLNWDAVLMNWRTRAFIFRDRYLDHIRERHLDVVLEQNPNPAGMAMRVFRHLCLKEALSVTPKAIEYLANCTALFPLQTLFDREIQSYGTSIIDPAMYRYFEYIKANEHLEMNERLKISGELTRMDAGELPLVY